MYIYICISLLYLGTVTLICSNFNATCADYKMLNVVKPPDVTFKLTNANAQYRLSNLRSCIGYCAHPFLFICVATWQFHILEVRCMLNFAVLSQSSPIVNE